MKVAYRRLAKKYHPDHYEGNPLADLAKERFIEIQEAYDTIMEGELGAEGFGASNGSYGKNQQNEHQSNNRSYEGNDENSNESSFFEIRRMIDQQEILRAREVLEEIEDRTAEWYFLTGQVDIMLGNYNSGLTCLREAIKIEPDNQEYKNYYDMISNQVNQYEENSKSNSLCNTICESIREFDLMRKLIFFKLLRVCYLRRYC